MADGTFPPFPTVAEWINSLPLFKQFADRFAFTEWDVLMSFSVEDLRELQIPGPAALPLAKMIGTLRPKMEPDSKPELIPVSQSDQSTEVSAPAQEGVTENPITEDENVRQEALVLSSDASTQAQDDLSGLKEDPVQPPIHAGDSSLALNSGSAFNPELELTEGQGVFETPMPTQENSSDRGPVSHSPILDPLVIKLADSSPEPKLSEEPPELPLTELPLAELPLATPPLTDPQPSLAESPLAEPPLAEPPLAEPSLAEPPLAESLLAEPPAAEPPLAEPPAAKIPPAEPPLAEPPPIVGATDSTHEPRDVPQETSDAPTNAQSAIAYTSDDLVIIFQFSYEENSLSATAEFRNVSSQNMTNFSMQLAVPKHLTVSIKPPSSTTVPPLSVCTQLFQVNRASPSVAHFVVRAKVGFYLGPSPKEVVFSFQFPQQPPATVSLASQTLPVSHASSTPSIHSSSVVGLGSSTERQDELVSQPIESLLLAKPISQGKDIIVHRNAEKEVSEQPIAVPTKAGDDFFPEQRETKTQTMGNLVKEDDFFQEAPKQQQLKAFDGDKLSKNAGEKPNPEEDFFQEEPSKPKSVAPPAAVDDDDFFQEAAGTKKVEQPAVPPPVDEDDFFSDPKPKQVTTDKPKLKQAEEEDFFTPKPIAAAKPAFKAPEDDFFTDDAPEPKLRDKAKPASSNDDFFTDAAPKAIDKPKPPPSEDDFFTDDAPKRPNKPKSRSEDDFFTVDAPKRAAVTEQPKGKVSEDDFFTEDVPKPVAADKPKLKLKAAGEKPKPRKDEDDDFFTDTNEPKPTSEKPKLVLALKPKSVAKQPKPESDEDDDFFADNKPAKKTEKQKTDGESQAHAEPPNEKSLKIKKPKKPDGTAKAAGEVQPKKEKSGEKQASKKESEQKESSSEKKTKTAKPKPAEKPPGFINEDMQITVQEVVKKPSFFSKLVKKVVPGSAPPPSSSSADTAKSTGAKPKPPASPPPKPSSKQKTSNLTGEDSPTAEKKTKSKQEGSKSSGSSKSAAESEKKRKEKEPAVEEWADFQSVSPPAENKKAASGGSSSKGQAVSTQAADDDDFFTDDAPPPKAKPATKTTTTATTAATAHNPSPKKPQKRGTRIDDFLNEEDSPNETVDSPKKTKGSAKKSQGTKLALKIDKKSGTAGAATASSSSDKPAKKQSKPEAPTGGKKTAKSGVALTADQAAALPLTEPHRRMVFEKMVIAYLLNTFQTELPEMLSDVNYKLLAFIACYLQCPPLTEEEAKRAGGAAPSPALADPADPFGGVFGKRATDPGVKKAAAAKSKASAKKKSRAKIAFSSSSSSSSSSSATATKSSAFSSFSSSSSSSPSSSRSSRSSTTAAVTTTKTAAITVRGSGSAVAALSPTSSALAFSIPPPPSPATSSSSPSSSHVEGHGHRSGPQSLTAGQLSVILSPDCLCGLSPQQYLDLPLRPAHRRLSAFHDLLFPLLVFGSSKKHTSLPEAVRRLILDFLPCPPPLERVLNEGGMELCAGLVAEANAVACGLAQPSNGTWTGTPPRIFLEMMIAATAVPKVFVKVRANAVGLQPLVAELDVTPATKKDPSHLRVLVPCVFDPNEVQELGLSQGELEIVFATRLPPDVRIFPAKVHGQDLCSALFAAPRSALDLEAFDRKWAGVVADVTSRSASYCCSMFPCCSIPPSSSSSLSSPSSSSSNESAVQEIMSNWLRTHCPYFMEVTSMKKRTNVLKFATTLQPSALKSGKGAALLQITVTSQPSPGRTAPHFGVKLEVACPGQVQLVSNVLKLLLLPLEVKA